MVKRGRPRKEDSRKIQKRVMFNNEENMLLRNISRKSGLTQSDIMRIGTVTFMNKLEQAYPEDEYNDWELGYYDDPEEFEEDF